MLQTLPRPEFQPRHPRIHAFAVRVEMDDVTIPATHDPARSSGCAGGY